MCAGVEAQPVAVPAPQDPPALNDAQKSAIRALQGESEQKTAQAARQLAGVVQKIYENNLLDTPNEELRATLDTQMRDLVWQMVSIKGNAMWTAFRLLTPEQKQFVRTEIAKPRPTGDLPDVLDLIVRTFQVTTR
jgi:Spy/CpxP family protein refolding chaperone